MAFRRTTPDQWSRFTTEPEFDRRLRMFIHDAASLAAVSLPLPALPVLRKDYHGERGVQAAAEVAVTGPLFVAVAV